MHKITPHLWYTKEAEEAAKFYASTFPDSRQFLIKDIALCGIAFAVLGGSLGRGSGHLQRGAIQS